MPLSIFCDVFTQCSNYDVRSFFLTLFIGVAILIVAIAFAIFLVRRAR